MFSIVIQSQSCSQNYLNAFATWHKTTLCRCSPVAMGAFGGLTSHAKYKKYRNKVTHLLEISKKSYYQSQFLSCRNDSGKMWKLINTLTSSKENVRALQRNYLTLSNQTTQAIHKSCPIYSTPTLSQSRFLPRVTIHIQKKLMVLKIHLCYMILLLRRWIW